MKNIYLAILLSISLTSALHAQNTQTTDSAAQTQDSRILADSAPQVQESAQNSADSNAQADSTDSTESQDSTLEITPATLQILTTSTLSAPEQKETPAQNKQEFTEKVIESALKSEDDFGENIKDIFPNPFIESAFLGFINGIESMLLKIDIRRISLTFSNKTLNVDDVYQENEISQFSGDNTMIIDGIVDLALEYDLEWGKFSNVLFAEYGATVLSRKGQSTTKSESTDIFLFNSGHTRKTFTFENGFLGPFVDGEYQTEFTKKENGSRDQYLRYKTGIRFLDGKYIDELYFAGLGEIDFSNPPTSINGALEMGIRAKTPINENLKLVYQGFARTYVGRSQHKDDDLPYNVNLGLRLDVGIYKGFAFSPYIAARFAEIRGSKKIGNNISTGIALLFSGSIDAVSSIQSTQDGVFDEYFKSIND